MDVSVLLWETLSLLIQWDSALVETAFAALQIAVSTLAIATFVGLPLGGMLAVKRFGGKELVVTLTNYFWGLPLFVAAVLVYLILSRISSGGVLGLLHKPTIMIVAQSMLLTPMMIAMSHRYIESEWRRLRPQLKSWRMNRQQALPTLFWGSRTELCVAVAAGFGRSAAEIGTLMIIGGLLDRVIPLMTATGVEQNHPGSPALLLASGMVLLFIALIAKLLVYYIGGLAKRQ